ncbi:unnamed protein product [Cyprideis torosa]|uniref:Ribosome maturation protein SBDS n=1 Tax=Cyprideis torosa TaxID=163714 RepID=A0A7R8W5A7_9CRUS|nr:unnamed protein product [Cyprideis torosa]CAG0882685.1 unnamed protein product [Cyprideis torosa]
MSKIFTPTNQKLLTNVAVVRYKRAGLRFEIACYKNSVLDWRRNIETDLDEVLQSRAIFENVSKGRQAKKEDIHKAFPDMKEEDIIKEILKKGELQISEKERHAAQEETLKAVATFVAETCVNPTTKRPYTVSMIEKAMKDIHFGVKPRQNTKQAANELVKSLKESGHFPIEKAQMRLKLTFLSSDYLSCKSQLKTYLKTLQEEETVDDETTLLCTADPGFYRQIEKLVVDDTKGRGSFEILSLLERKEGDEDITELDKNAFSGFERGDHGATKEAASKKKGGGRRKKKQSEGERSVGGGSEEEGPSGAKALDSDDDSDWAKKGKKDKKKKKKKAGGGNVAAKKAESDAEESEEEEPNKAKEELSDSDDDGKKKKGKKRGKKGGKLEVYLLEKSVATLLIGLLSLDQGCEVGVLETCPESKSSRNRDFDSGRESWLGSTFQSSLDRQLHPGVPPESESLETRTPESDSSSLVDFEIVGTFGVAVIPTAGDHDIMSGGVRRDHELVFHNMGAHHLNDASLSVMAPASGGGESATLSPPSVASTGSANLYRKRLSLDLSSSAPQRKRMVLNPPPVNAANLKPEIEGGATTPSSANPVLSSPDLKKLQLTTPELDLLARFPSWPKSVTEEQELYAKQFEELVAQQSSLSAVSTLPSDPPLPAPPRLESLPVPLPAPPRVEVLPISLLTGGARLESLPSAASPASSQPSPKPSRSRKRQSPPSPGFSSPPGSVLSDATSSIPSPSPSLCGGGSEEQEKLRLERKRLRNRIAASKCRQKKLDKISELQKQISILASNNDRLSEEASQLRHDVEALQKQFLRHQEAGCALLPPSAAAASLGSKEARPLPTYLPQLKQEPLDTASS